MERYINKQNLKEFLTELSKSDTTVHAVRRSMFTVLQKSVIMIEPHESTADQALIPKQDYNNLWQFLTARNEKITDDQRLAFTASVDRLMELTATRAVDLTVHVDKSQMSSPERLRDTE